MNPSRNSIFAVAWREWLEKAKTDSEAQMKTNRLLISPEFELYDLKNDPWEMNNLATNPEYAQVVKQMHEKLKADMKEMNDEFSSIDPKDAKKARKAKQKEQGQDPKKKKSSKKKGSDSNQSDKADKKKKREKKKAEK
jgi:type II secretory pathway component GspD/PulD (secretin)